MTATLQDRYESVHANILAGPNAELQGWVDSGTAWRLEGHVGRVAMDALRSGALVLGPKPTTDYWGSRIPSYIEVKDAVGSPGSVANAENYDEDEERW